MLRSRNTAAHRVGSPDSADRRDRGAVAVEMAVVLPVLVLLVFGMVEMGLVFKDRLTISHAVNQATRHATVLGTDDYADIEILGALESALSGRQRDAIISVRIFEADASGSVLGSDLYRRDDGSSCGWVPCPDPDPGPPIYGDPSTYPPCARDVKLIGDGVDTIGVQVEYTHTWITGVLGLSPQTWHETARARMEPDLSGSGGATC